MIFAIYLMAERLTTVAMFGAILVVGIFVVTGNPFKRGSRHLLKGMLWGAATGVTIASYTLWDGYLVTSLHLAPATYFASTILLQSLILTPSALRRRHRIPTAVFAKTLSPLRGTDRKRSSFGNIGVTPKLFLSLRPLKHTGEGSLQVWPNSVERLH